MVKPESVEYAHMPFQLHDQSDIFVEILLILHLIQLYKLSPVLKQKIGNYIIIHTGSSNGTSFFCYKGYY